MDFATIGALFASLKAAKELGQAALAVHEFNEMAPVISNLNSELLKAQDSLFTHNMELLTLQQEYLKATKELAEVRESLAEKARYALFEITPGAFVYRAEARPASPHETNPVAAEPEHFICQQCFDSPERRKSALKRIGHSEWNCHACKNRIFVAQTGSGITHEASVAAQLAAFGKTR
jgi:hypothetical protein